MNYGIVPTIFVISYLSPLCARHRAKHSLYLISFDPPKMFPGFKHYTVLHQSRSGRKTDPFLCTEPLKTMRGGHGTTGRSCRLREDNSRHSRNIYDQHHVVGSRLDAGDTIKDSDMDFILGEYKEGDFSQVF